MLLAKITLSLHTHYLLGKEMCEAVFSASKLLLEKSVSEGLVTKMRMKKTVV